MIVAQSISKRLGGRDVLSDVSLTAPDGEVTGFIGPNGAGKTTLMKIIAGVITADAGTALVDGTPYADAERPGAALGMHINGEWLPSRVSGLAHLRYVCDTQSVSHARIRPILEEVGLWGAHTRAIATYSLGMRQRLGIAATLMTDAANLMLDEPVNGLDPNGVIWLRDLLRKQAAEGKAVLLSSHLMAELELVADRFVMLNQGRVVGSGTMRELSRSTDSEGVYITARNLPDVVALLEQASLRVRPERDGAVVLGSNPEQVGALVFGNGLTLTHLAAHSQSLEEIFLTSTAGARNARSL